MNDAGLRNDRRAGQIRLQGKIKLLGVLSSKICVVFVRSALAANSKISNASL